MRSALVLCLALPQLADARPITAGVGVGRIQSEVDAQGEGEDTLQLFARVGLTPRLSAQLELSKIDSDYSDRGIRTGTALLVVDIASRGRLIPTIFAGYGLDRADQYGYELTGSHIEGGFGLEYRADGGLTVGVDFRLGGRSVDDNDDVLVLAETGTALLYAPVMYEGEYRSGRLFAAVRF